MTFCQLSVSCKIHQEKVFGDILVRKQSFLNNKNMDLRKLLKFFHHLCLSKRDREKEFADVLDRKEAFQDSNNIAL